jgi:hypothetical protein
MPRAAWGVAALALLAIPAANALGVEPTDTPAPEGTASGQAAAVGDVIGVGQSHATATQDTASADAQALAVNGEATPSQAGGSADGNADASGAVASTGETPAGQVAVAPWSASASSDGGSRQAEASSALAEATVLDPNALTLAVLASSSSAQHSGLQSAGHASSDGAVVQAGGDEGLTLVVLHSEADSSGTGESYLLGVGDTKVVTNEQADTCTAEVPSLVALVCLTVEGGPGNVAAEVLAATVGDDAAGAGIVRASTSSGTGTAGAPPEVLSGLFETPRGGAGGGLAATGAPSPIVAIGLTLILLGAATLGLRRQAVPAA